MGRTGEYESTDQPRYIGRYRVVERIGKGAMGMVFAAADDTIGRSVAIKVMMADLREEPSIRKRFYREAKVTGQLAHANIVTVLDFGEDEGHPFLVMELLAGLPLLQHLATPEGDSLDARVGLMMQTLEGLQAAHAQGVTHRDIKPNNLFVTRDGTLKILDFGVARLAESTLTRVGFLLGTPEFMSPEQAQGHAVDARSDLFSAASVFYTMLAGDSPFAAPELPDVLQGVMHGDPPPLTDAQAPEPLRRLLLKALAKNPADRYQQCAEMLMELQRLRRSYEGTTRRMEHACLDRYQQIVTAIEELRTFGRSIGQADIDAGCDDALAKLAARFPILATHAAAGGLLEPMDRAAATATLESLQRRHNAALAAVAALKAEAADRLRVQQPVRKADADLSLRERASALFRRGRAKDGA